MMRRKIFRPAMFFAVAFTAFMVVDWLGVFTPAVPAAWAQIHVGMKRDGVQKLVGPTQFNLLAGKGC